MRLPTFLLGTLLATACALAHAQANPALVGRWTMVDSSLHLSDGRVVPQQRIKCESEFSPTQLISACQLTNDITSRVVFSYKWLKGDTYELEILEHPTVQSSVGSRYKAEYHVAGAKLVSIAYPPPRPVGPAIDWVESVLVREGMGD